MPPSPEEKTPDQGNNQNPIDLDSILLPKKETGPNPESAQRVNAGALLAQESAAQLPKTEPKSPERLNPAAPAPAAPPPQTMQTPLGRSTPMGETKPATPLAPAPSVPAPLTPPAPSAPAVATPPPPAAPEVAPFAKSAAAPAPVIPATPAPAAPAADNPDAVRPLQTYKSDVERVVVNKGVSVVSVAAAEAERRGTQPLQTPEEKDARNKTIVMVLSGILLLVIAGGVIAFIATRPTTVPVAAVPNAPFIIVDEASIVPVPKDQNDRDSLMTNLSAARQKSNLSLGLVEWFYLEEPPTERLVPARQVSIYELLGTISPDIPADLTRVLGQTYFIGVHSFDENQPFLLMQVDSYEVAYKGMLDWERTMRRDLSPLFNRNPSPRLPTQGATGATSTPQFLQTGFVDKVVENRDTRAIVNDDGEILLLWTFLGRNIILITTNEYTLREVISRLSAAPVVPIPAAQGR